MRPRDVVEVLGFAIRNKFPILLKGSPGVGKTSMVKQVAETLKQDLIISHPVVSEPTDYKGLPFPNNEGTAADFLPYGDLRKLVSAKKPTIYFLDDLGQSFPAVQAACMQLLLAREINGKKISDHITFLAATNKRTDKAGVQGILEPVKSRFTSIIEVDVNKDDWVLWAYTHNMPAELIAFIRYLPKHLENGFKPTNDVVNTSNPRTIENVGKIMNAGVGSGLELEMFGGAAGEGFASEFLGFLRIYRNLPSIPNILSNPDIVDIVKDPSILYAVSGALVNNVNKKNIGNIIKYLERMPEDFQVVAMRDIAQSKKAMVETSAYTAWAVKHSDILIDTNNNRRG